jgi:hypothetical protein
MGAAAAHALGPGDRVAYQSAQVEQSLIPDAVALKSDETYVAAKVERSSWSDAVRPLRRPALIAAADSASLTETHRTRGGRRSFRITQVGGVTQPRCDTMGLMGTGTLTDATSEPSLQVSADESRRRSASSPRLAAASFMAISIGLTGCRLPEQKPGAPAAQANNAGPGGPATSAVRSSRPTGGPPSVKYVFLRDGRQVPFTNGDYYDRIAESIDGYCRPTAHPVSRDWRPAEYVCGNDRVKLVPHETGLEVVIVGGAVVVGGIVALANYFAGKHKEAQPELPENATHAFVLRCPGLEDGVVKDPTMRELERAITAWRPRCR